MSLLAMRLVPTLAMLLFLLFCEWSMDTTSLTLPLSLITTSPFFFSLLRASSNMSLAFPLPSLILNSLKTFSRSSLGYNPLDLSLPPTTCLRSLRILTTSLAKVLVSRFFKLFLSDLNTLRFFFLTSLFPRYLLAIIGVRASIDLVGVPPIRARHIGKTVSMTRKVARRRGLVTFAPPRAGCELVLVLLQFFMVLRSIGNKLQLRLGTDLQFMFDATA
mmetsp:Transcript_25769/g.55817  ORF Transcript_25769/g.55817 Transcript_25769/m.55817 type:complete len:218 (+) Transcript_25769:521-1174(+)